jgi:two-component system chemotaxis response regulator CheY
MRLIIKKAVLHNLENIEVYEASDGKEAMTMLEKHPDMDVMFLDWNMPNMNGEEVVDRVASMKKYHVKIIMATTEGASDKVKKMVTKGVKGYLIKPFNPKAVIAVATKMAKLCRGEEE